MPSAQGISPSATVVDSAITAHEYGAILELQQTILELVALGCEAGAVLERLCQMAESLVPKAVATVLILDAEGQCLNVLSAPSVPPEGIPLLNGLRPGPHAGSCGNAVYLGEPVFVDNTLTDPRWQDLRHIARNFGLCACWSLPIRSANQRIIGTFALSSFEHGMPTAFQRRLLDICASIASIVIERREQAVLLTQSALRLRLAATAFANAADAIIVTDHDNRIVEVNRAFERIFGYAAEEVLGKNPNFLGSGQHDRGFYRRLWQSLDAEGQWSGEISNRHKSGETLQLWVSISALRGEGRAGERSYLAVYTDLSELRASQQKLAFMAYHDPLTGLANRAYLFERLERAIIDADRSRGWLALLFLDLDRFKNLNDTFGHLLGDKILIQVARRLQRLTRATDTLVRLGGDEFVILIEADGPTEQADAVAEKVLGALRRPFSHGGRRFLLSASIGIALFPDHGDTAETLLRNADTAMYEAKAQGRSTFVVYARDMSVRAEQMFTLETDLRIGLQNREFELYLQPKVDAITGAVAGAEVLLRWHHPRRGLLSPNDFLGVAEDTGLVIPIGDWVLEQTCALLCRLCAAGLELPLAVNLSGRQFNPADLDRLLGIVQDSGVPPRLLELEFTETFLMQHTQRTSQLLERIRAAGLQLAIDDFGSGYSSLSYLKQLPANCLKIDSSLIAEIEHDPRDLAILAAIVTMGHSLGLKVVAEGVDTATQHRLLRDAGCDLLQGYLFGEPMPIEQFFERLRHAS